MISPYKITYNGISSLEMDCLTCVSFGGDAGDVETHLTREAVISESYNGSHNRIHGYKWSESFTFSITFTKSDFSDFTDYENRKMLKWLTGNPHASFIDVYKDDSNTIAWSSLGNWVNVSSYKLGNGRIVGYVAEWESSYPWAFSHLKTKTKELNESTITLEIETDDPQNAIYPRITIQQDSTLSVVSINHAMTDTDVWVDGTVYKYNNTYYWVDADGVKHTSTTNTSGLETTSVSIMNTHTDILNNVTTFNTLVKNNIKGETVVLDGANRVVSSSRDSRIFGDNFDWKWIPLYDGKNVITVTGNCIVKFEYREPYKVGEF